MQADSNVLFRHSSLYVFLSKNSGKLGYASISTNLAVAPALPDVVHGRLFAVVLREGGGGSQQRRNCDLAPSRRHVAIFSGNARRVLKSPNLYVPVYFLFGNVLIRQFYGTAISIWSRHSTSWEEHSHRPGARDTVCMESLK